MLVVLGSINADLVFRVESLPRPGETVSCASFAFHHGGKGANQACAAARAGAVVRFVGCVGEDAWGPVLRRGLEEAGVDTSLLATSPRPSGTAVIAVDETGENAILVASGANLDVSADQLDRAGLGKGTTLLCQNEIPLATTRAGLARGRALGARTILNFAPAVAGALAVLDEVDVLVVNHGEATRLLDRDLPPEAAVRALASHTRTCVLTLGRDGALAVGPEGAWHVPALPVEPVDTTGAGDTFTGVLAAGLDLGLPWTEALARAAVAAGIVCERLGARSGQPTSEEVAARRAELPPVLPLALS
ncbi:MAG: ribokinase [Geminicoccaceae bacterium]|nr:ribokinase [Geminicoccaceae bacterium]MCS7268083.1 ribokinase [Geminicoccaceae bacterium]MDW8125983.1 ribokinase [Geminicoccaceae bacterium]MDW8342331.1 ribokinase [Geminicoccaceae bacterium]